MTQATTGNVAAEARTLRSRGFALCKPDRGTKSPTYKRWGTRSLEPEDFGADDLIGIIGGPLSDGNHDGHAAVILDLDAAEAIVIADKFLPETGMIEGRAGKPRSHRYYLIPCDTIPDWAESYAEQSAETAYELIGFRGPFSKSFRHKKTNKEILKFIGTGGQGVCPPSLWVSKDGTRQERREWAGAGEPLVVPFPKLWEAVCRLAHKCGARMPSGLSWPWEAAPSKRAPGTRTTFTYQDTTDPKNRAIAYIKKLPAAISGLGGRDATLWAARAVVYGFDLGVETGFDILNREFNPRCLPPWSEKELRAKCREADVVPFDKPRAWLRDTPPPSNGDGKHENNPGDFRAEITSGNCLPQPAPLPTMPAVPPFPIDVFPSKVSGYWKAAAEALGVPVDYVAVPGMALLGAAVGRSRAAEVKLGYSESPLFWVVTFAPPGTTKSPALRVARAPLQKAEARWIDEHRENMSVFGVEMDRHAVAMKEWKANGCNGEPPDKPDKPRLRQATLDDATVEATARVLADNPRGVAVVKDELIGFVRAQNQYKGGRGADREFWLSAWAGAAAKVNRAANHDAGPLYIPHPFVAIAGMMCPDSLAELRGENRRGDALADGFLDRFLLSFPDPLDAAAESWRTIPEETEQAYCDVFLDLLAMEMVPEDEGKRLRPYFVHFSDRGRAAWEEFTGNMAARMNNLDSFDPFRGVLSKLRGYGLRFASLLWCLARVCGSQDANVDADMMIGASRLVDYFEKHASRCLGRGWADRTTRIAHRLIAWLLRNPDRNGFNRSEAFQALKDRRDVLDSESLAPAFKLLIDHGYILPLDRPENLRPGPVPEAYAVNGNWTRKL